MKKERNANLTLEQILEIKTLKSNLDRMVVFASGKGSNFHALAQHFSTQIEALVCNREDAPVIEIAKKYNISCYVIPHKNYSTRSEHEIAVWNELNKINSFQFIVLAGYMRVLSPTFFEKLGQKKIINLHPAHLEDYKGAHAYEFAVEHKFPRWGLSVHDVTPKLDSGALIHSTEFAIFPYESVEQLKSRVQKIEHNLLVESVQSIFNKKRKQ